MGRTAHAPDRRVLRILTRVRLRAILVALSLAGAASGAMVAQAGPARAAGPPVFLVGDSVMQVFNFSYGRPGRAVIDTAYTTDVDAYQCRRLITLGCRPGPSAIEVMRAHVPLPKVMVMTVGHNEKDDFPNKIDTIMREAEALGVETVVWLTYHNAIRATAYPGNNAAVFAGATRWPRMKVADWDAYAQGHAVWFSTSDGLHLTPEGAIKYGEFIKTSLDQLVPPPPTPTRCDVSRAIGTPAPPLAPLPPDPPTNGSRIVPIAPARLIDTRTGQADNPAAGRLGGGRVLDVVVAGRVGIPATATGAVLNVTVIDACETGFATVYPAGAANAPLASNSNFGPGEVVAALASTRLGTGGAASIYTSAQTDVVVDVVGYLQPATGSRYNAVDPFRVVDSRPAGVGAGQEIAVPIRGAGGTIPAGTTVKGAVLNLTVTGPAAAGYLTVYPGPCNPATRPVASNLNYTAGQTIANLVVASVGADGSVCVFSSTAGQVIVDAAGWLGDTGAPMFGITPQRLVDTRTGGAALHNTIKGRIGPGSPLVVPAGVSSGVPADATAAMLNVTVVGPASAGYLTVYPCGTAVPNASNVNYAAFSVRPNLVAATIGAGDAVCLFAEQPTDVLVDLAGWFR